MSKGLPRSLKKLYDNVLSGGGAPMAGTSKHQATYVRKETINFTDAVLAAEDATGVIGHANVKIFDFPEGHILFLGAVINLVVTKDSAGINDDWDGNVGLGTAAEDGTAAPLDGTMQDLIPDTDTPQAVSGSSTFSAESTATESGVFFDGTATALEAFLNVLIDDTDHDIDGTPANLILNGSITLIYVNLGDN